MSTPMASACGVARVTRASFAPYAQARERTVARDTRAVLHGATISGALRDGTRVCLRALRRGDEARLQRGFERLSARSVRRRFFHAVKQFTSDELRRATELDFHDRIGLVLAVRDGDDEALIGEARLVRVSAGSERAEMAIVVADEYQHRGAGALLTRYLVAAARAVGVRELLALVLADNGEMLALLRKTRLPLRRKPDGEICEIVLSVDQATDAP